MRVRRCISIVVPYLCCAGVAVLAGCVRTIDTPTENQQRYTFLDRLNEGHSLDEHYDATYTNTVGLFVTDNCSDIYVGANRFWVDRKADDAVGGGIGALINNGQCVITARHVLKEQSRACVVGRADNSQYRATGSLVWSSVEDDLALLHLDHPAMNGFTWSPDVVEEEVVWTVGIVSPAGGFVQKIFGIDKQTVQSSLRLTFGDSGSPLVNSDGEIVAVNTRALASIVSLDVNGTLSSRPSTDVRDKLFEELCSKHPPLHNEDS